MAIGFLDFEETLYPYGYSEGRSAIAVFLVLSRFQKSLNLWGGTPPAVLGEVRDFCFWGPHGKLVLEG